MSSGYPKSIKKQLDELASQKERVLSWFDAATIAEAAKAQFDIIESVSVSIGVHSLNGVLIHCLLDRPQDVADLLRWLAVRGYRQKCKPDDFAEIKRRTWNLGDIQVMGFFRGETCKFVEVGKKEEPVFELRCTAEEVDV